MKLVAVSSSPVKKGNTENLPSHMLEIARQQGFEVERFDLSGMIVKPCVHCNACMRHGGFETTHLSHMYLFYNLDMPTVGCHHSISLLARIFHEPYQAEMDTVCLKRISDWEHS